MISIFLRFLGGVLILDWVVAWAVTHGYLSQWIFFAVNIPFGGLFIWTESNPDVYRYIGDRDRASFAVFLLVVLLQGSFYFGLWRFLMWRSQWGSRERTRP